MTSDSALHRDLADLADEADLGAPTCTVTAAHGITAGRRSVRTRQTAGLGAGAAAVIAAAAISVPALLSHTSPSSPATQGPAADSSAPQFTGGSDPLTTAAAYGWLPDGLTTVSVSSQPGQPDQIDANNAPQSTDVNLTVYSAGQQVLPVHFKGGIIAPHTVAPPVNGHDAYWTFVPGSSQAASDGEANLVWEYAPNAWASLAYDTPAIATNTTNATDPATTAAVTTTIYKVADSVTFNGPAAQPMPIHLPAPANLPSQVAGLSYQATGTTPGAQQFVTASVAFSTAPDTGAGDAPPHGTVQSRLVLTAAPPGHLDPAANLTGPTTDLTVDGHQAQLQTGPTSARLTVYGVNGLDVQILAAGPELTTINANGGLVAYYHTVTWLGPNPTNWTTSVIGGK